MPLGARCDLKKILSACVLSLLVWYCLSTLGHKATSVPAKGSELPDRPQQGNKRETQIKPAIEVISPNPQHFSCLPCRAMVRKSSPILVRLVQFMPLHGAFSATTDVGRPRPACIDIHRPLTAPHPPSGKRVYWVQPCCPDAHTDHQLGRKALQNDIHTCSAEGAPDTQRSAETKE